MKNVLSILAISMLASMSSAFAGTVRMDANDYASLPDCGGVIQTKIANYATQLNLIFSNVSQCSNFDIVSANGDRVNYPNQKLQGRDNARAGSFTIPSSFIDYGSNTIRVKLNSNSGKHSDTIIVSVRQVSIPTPPTRPTGPVISMDSNDYRSLNFCGGTVQTKVSNGQLNVIFQNVSQCSNFDILKSNGDRVNYPNLKLQGRDGARAGSFTLPQSVIDYGSNTVTVRLNSNSGKTWDTIVIRFRAW